MTDEKARKAPATPVPNPGVAAPRKPSPAELAWEESVLGPSLAKSPDRSADFTTVSSYPIRRLYTGADLGEWNSERDLGAPGEPPYTRGIHPAMYRERLWTMRQFAGFGSAEDTNRRFRYLLAQGQTGLSVAFDLPTLMGYDSDHPLARRRSRQMRRGDQFARRHGGAVRPDSPGRRHHVDDHQFAGRARSGRCIWRWRKSKARTGRALRARCRTTS